MIPLKLDNSNRAECWAEAALEAEATGRAEVRREDGSLVCVLAVSRDELVCDDAQCVEVRARLVAVEQERDELRAALERATEPRLDAAEVEALRDLRDYVSGPRHERYAAVLDKLLAQGGGK